jgi:glucose/arabinose dehydrogenase
MPRLTLMTSTAVSLTAGMALAQDAAPVQQGPKTVEDFTPAFEAQTRAPEDDSGLTLDIETIAGGLVHPWGIAILPGDAGYLVTERPGRLRHVAEDGTLSAPVAGTPEVVAEQQGGLLDVQPGPDFETTRRVYMTYAKPVGDGLSATAAAYGTLSEDMTELMGVTDIFVQEPGSANPMHFGSRIVFDGDGHAFITTGEHFTETERQYSQDLDKTYGKTIRVGLDGATPEGNPFTDESDAVSTIWSYGHRNVQGAAFRPSNNELWVIEHGPAGGDELNRVEAGANYGWPVVAYGENYDGTPVGSGDEDHAARGFVEPRYYWDPVIAPGDMTFYQGDVFADWQGDVLIGGLVAGDIVRVSLEGSTVTGEEWLGTELGRVRDVAVDDDGAILAITDYEDGGFVRITPDASMN